MASQSPCVSFLLMAFLPGSHWSWLLSAASQASVGERDAIQRVVCLLMTWKENVFSPGNHFSQADWVPGFTRCSGLSVAEP